VVSPHFAMTLTITPRNHRARARPMRMTVASALLLAGALLASPRTATAAASFDCVLNPALTLKLGSPVASVIASVDVDRGDLVKKGQVIAHLESAVEKADVALDQAKAGSLAEISAKQVKVELTKGEFGRQSALLQRQDTSGQKYDQARADYESAQQDLALAQLDHNLAALELQRAEATLDQRIIRSPIDGIVTQRSLGPGEYLNQQESILTVAQIDPLHVETFLPIRYYGQIKVGDTATVRPEDPVGGERAAKVTVVDQVFDAASGTFGIRLDLPNADHSVPGGLRCRVTFAIPEITETPSPVAGAAPASDFGTK
jgi:RND family efflux transporter MFP subunit